MTTIFNKVHGFNLKLPLNTASRQYPDNYGEWIEIIKKPNELPTVKLKTIVLYYRNNGDTTSFDSNNYQNIPRGESGGNYRFYNDIQDCSGQMGWIWGFPLFDVSGSSGNWPKFKSCIGNDISGNEKMLVSLKEQKNIIVLDCSGLQPTTGSGCKDISNNITGISGNFFMTLRIKNSKETDFNDFNFQDYGAGRGGNWNLWDGGTQKYTKWASLVQYEYECDIIGPKGMLDFTFDYFMINDSDTGRPIYQKDSSVKNYLAIPNNLSNFNSSRESSCKIITGLQTGDATVIGERMDITNILTNLSSIAAGGPKRLEIKENWNKNSSSTVVKLIGGWYSDNSTNDLSNCYYGDNIGDGDFQTNMTQTVTHKTEGWKNFINLSTGDPYNDWSGNSHTSSYELNNILWCSLQSKRKLPVRKLYGNNNFKRYITNWIDLSGGDDTSNEIIGGGYGRYPNTIDMVRGSKNPYYSSSVNGKTVSIPNFVPDTINYFDASNNTLTEHDLNFFRVRYQLLIPPGDDEEFEISFTMGQDISSSVTTFFRHTGMDGSCNPVGDNNLKANRKKETITLTWDNTSVNSVNDISMQSIYFTDIASGFSHIDASFNCTDTSLNTIVTDMSKNYDISFNVFQLHFLAKSGDDRKETPYTVKSFNNNNTTQQYFDISFVPQNYEPYRYINYNKSKLGDSIETNFYFYGNHDISKVYQEQLEYNPMGRFVKGTGTTFNITASIPQPIIDISSIPRVYGITGNSTPTLPDEDIFVLTQSTGQTQITSVSGEYPVAVGPNNFKAIFYSPSSLKLGNNFIPDYWRLPDKINTLRTKYPSDYSYFDDWEKQIKVSMVYDILSLSLKGLLSGETVSPAITHILINSKNESPQFDAGTKEDGSLVSNLNGSDLIFEVQGWKDLSDNDQLNQSPIVIELSANPGPFGPSGNSFIDGINVPYTAKSEEKYKVNTILLDKMRKKINVSTTDASYNGIFTIHISAWDDVSNNKIYAGTKMNPVNGVEVLLVDLPEITQTNGEIIVTVNNLTNALDMIDSNNSVIITWESFDFSKDTTWVTSQSNVYWTISRYNISTGKSKVVLNNETIVDLNENDEYQYIDDDVRVYEKFRYTVTGTFKWDIGSKKLELDIPGFTTSDCFVCKNNRFPYGRFNSTSSNFKLYRPLLINTLEGQVDQFGNKTCGGGCIANNAPGLNLYSQRSRISSSNNIYSNTTNQMSKKETYVRLSRSRFRPDR